MSREPKPPSPNCCESTFDRWLLAILAGALLWRIGYTLLQPGYDPNFAEPMLDGAFYVNWGEGILQGLFRNQGAYYRAPLYAYALAAFFKLFGVNYVMLYLLQHLLTVLAAGLLATGLRRRIGAAAALSTAALYLLYPPLLFFAAHPLGESLALFLLALALALVERGGVRSRGLAGVILGLACLARPNLLLVGAVWVVYEGWRGRRRQAAWILCGMLLVIAPVTVRNYVRSGHLSLISSNVGMTLYHGNGPGAKGTYTNASALSGDPIVQREEALGIARIMAEDPDLDAVETDRWWGARAVETRLADPVDSLWLVGRRALLTLDNHEHGLDYAPSLDTNPMRLTLRFPWYSEIGVVPLALLLGLAAAALVQFRWSGSGGTRTWWAILACTATPLVFYMSSRYRLPAAALLCIPAGVGLAGLAGWRGTVGRRTRTIAAMVGALVLLGSLLIPSRSIILAERATGLSNRAASYARLGADQLAEEQAKLAVASNPNEPRAWFNLGVILEDQGRAAEAEAAYRAAIEREPGLAEAAGNFARLVIGRGAAQEALIVLELALETRPTHEPCWANLIVALVELGRTDAALAAAAQAKENGVVLDPGLLATLRQLAARPVEEPEP